jgi:hypothetical protein
LEGEIKMKAFSCLPFLLLLTTSALCLEGIKSVKIAVKNPTNSLRVAADVVLSIPDLRKSTPDFTPGSVLVTCTSAATLEQDVEIAESTELPSQVDDLDGDGKGDEIAFQIDLGPNQTRIVTIFYGPPDRILRIRNEYAQRTNALFSSKIEGLGWESERIAFRVYFDPRNDIDIYGKRSRSLQLKLFASPDYPYHEESPKGRDIFKIGESIGIGAVAAWADGKLVKAADVRERKWRIVSVGPVRAIVELDYSGWNLGPEAITLRSRIVQWAGEHGFYHTIAVDPPSSTEFVSGVTAKQGVALEKSIPDDPGSVAWLATWGEQVVAPGATATEAMSGQNLGLAVLTNMQPVKFTADRLNDLFRFRLHDGKAGWYAMAAWDQEDTEQYDESVNKQGTHFHLPAIPLPDSISTKGAFLSAVKDQALRMRSPIIVHVLPNSNSTGG